MRTIRLAFATLLSTLLATLLASGPALAGKDLDAVKARGALICGVAANGLAGFMVVSSQGKWTGLDVDVCRAVAAAIFGDSRSASISAPSPTMTARASWCPRSSA